MIQRTTRFVPRDFDIFAGLDVDKKSISATFADHEMAARSIHIPYDADNLLNYVASRFAGKRVAFAYEAGPTGYGLYDSIKAAGYPCLVVAACKIPMVRGVQVKTNRIDSKRLAESLRAGELKSIHVPSESYRNLRHLVQLRDTCVRQSTSTKFRIKSLLLLEGIPYPESASPSGHVSQAVMAELRRLPCNAAIRFKINQLVSTLEFSREQVVATTKEIRRFCLEDEEVRRNILFLMSIPGIGWIVATHLLARIGDWREMGNVRQLGSFLGLTQREASTGDEVRRGSITRVGDGRLRNKLVQGAWVAIRQDPELRRFYERIYQRHPKQTAAKKAIVAVARKMTMRIHAVLTGQRNYIVNNDLSSEETDLRERLDGSQN